MIPLIGYPLEHSYTVELQNRVYEHEGLDFLRIPIEVREDGLEDVIKGLRRMNIAGVSFTKPNKIAAIPYLDELDPLAESIGAVNATAYRDGKLIGYNTDGEGFILSLYEQGLSDLAGRCFFCLGAGGAGRAITTTLAAHGAGRIVISDKLPQAADSLADRIHGYYPDTVCQVVAMETEPARAALAESDVVLNMTGLGMYPYTQVTPLVAGDFHTGQLVFDASYNPERTLFLQEAEKAGCRVFNGKMMLAYCGMLGYEIVTGAKAPREYWLELLEEISASSAGDAK